MMEQPDACKGHCYAILVADLYHVIVPYGAAGLGDKIYAGLMGPLNVVAEGEESV